MSKFKINDVVLIPEHLSIGIIINEGKNPNGHPWYRTDAEGVREDHELKKITTVKEIRDAQFNGYLVCNDTMEAIVENQLLEGTLNLETA